MSDSNRIDFTKMHGTGNDFVLVEKKHLPDSLNITEFAKKVCDRRFGVGSDGLLILAANTQADFEMIFHNPDGSIAEMCGNGIRCLAKYIFDKHHSDKKELRIQTGKGILNLKLDIDGNSKVEWVEVEMGYANFNRKDIPVEGDADTALAETIDLGEVGYYEFHAVNVGNPHAVIFVDDVDRFPVRLVGPMIETHPMFPRRINVEFVKHISPENIKVRIWERGAGETLSCGTGVCAAGAVSRKLGIISSKVFVDIPGGRLEVRFGDDDNIYLGGPAEEVFTGTLESDILDSWRLI